MASFVGRSIKVVKGRKVPIGTVGNCFWSKYTKYGLRVGLMTADGTKYFTAASNVALETPVEEENYSPFDREVTPRGPGLDSDDPGPVVPKKPYEAPKASALLWSKKEKVGDTKQTSYYDISVYKIPVLGDVNVSKIYEALRKRFPYRGDLGAAGGYTTVERVEKVKDENAVEVALYYHIGD